MNILRSKLQSNPKKEHVCDSVNSRSQIQQSPSLRQRPSTAIRRLLVANRGEIAIRICHTCAEMGIESVAVYCDDDRLSLHRKVADRAVQIAPGRSPVLAYLDIDAVITAAQKVHADAVHPGYGFLAENPGFAEACRRANLLFIGPDANIQCQLGDKIVAKKLAEAANVPVLPGTNALESERQAKEFGQAMGYPLLLKAASGGGGRGIRVVTDPGQVAAKFAEASREAQTAFGDTSVFAEQYLDNPKHVEVQILGDQCGNLLHLFERDCSIQRRHQKLIEFAPAVGLNEDIRQRLHDYALRIARKVNYYSAGTVEFLVSASGEIFFIEVNPRIQVEHTVTEEALGIDLIRMQLLVAEGFDLHGRVIGLPHQDGIQLNRSAIQCRITTEDPSNGFAPDHGIVAGLRLPKGRAIRLDTSIEEAGARISDQCDSLLLKLTASGATLEDAAASAMRALRDTAISGINTNRSFLINVLSQPMFLNGKAGTRFIEKHPDLLSRSAKAPMDVALGHIAQVTVNGLSGVPYRPAPQTLRSVPLMQIQDQPPPKGSRDIFKQDGIAALQRWVRAQSRLLLADTTMRDANQSLLASRLRTFDMLRIAEATAHYAPNYFAIETWGGSNFDVGLRFLKEDPFERLYQLRSRIPSILFQSLLRGSNTVGYIGYPDNMVRRFIELATEAGIDVFRVMDPLNWPASMTVAMEAVNNCGAICEAAICYAGNILDPKRDKYPLTYYTELAQEFERMGAHILCIKDMAGILKPLAARKLINALRQATDLPIHIHTHDTSGNANLVIWEAMAAGADIADTALSSMSGLTGLPSCNSLAAAFEGDDRRPDFNLDALQALAEYWEAVRTHYAPFETGMRTSTAQVYRNEIPGGQYASLRIQVEHLGLGNQWNEVKQMYCRVSDMFGDPIKATPIPKLIGDTAILMVQNSIEPEQVLSGEKEFPFTKEAIDYLSGLLGQPPGGFPKQLQRIALRGRELVTCRIGDLLDPIDFAEERLKLSAQIRRQPRDTELMAYLTFPEAFEIFHQHRQQWGDTAFLPTPLFFYGLQPGEVSTFELPDGTSVQVKLIAIGEPEDGDMRTVCLEVDGAPRHIRIKDEHLISEAACRPKADPNNPLHIGAPMSGTIIDVRSGSSDTFAKGDTLVILEAMKMETHVPAPFAGKVTHCRVAQGDMAETGELLLEVEPSVAQ